jgi:cathepsin L
MRNIVLVLLIALLATVSIHAVKVNVKVDIESTPENNNNNSIQNIKPTTTISETPAKPDNDDSGASIMSIGEFDEAVSSDPDPSLLDFPTQMARYIKSYDKTYPRAELVQRARAFRENLLEVVNWNHNPDRSYDQTLNQYSDLDDDEFRHRIAGIDPKALETIQSLAELDEANEAELDEYEVELDEAHSLPEKLNYPGRPIDIDPISGRGGKRADGMPIPIVSAGNAANPETSLDWKARGKVTSIKQQGICGACWAFSSMAALESAYAIKTNRLQNLSPQWLVDCNTGADPQYGGQKNRACEGGAPQLAYNFLKTNPAVLDSVYPYKGRKGACMRVANTGIVTKGFEQIRNDANRIKASLSISPLVVLLSSSTKPFRSYNKGIIDGSACGSEVDHGVTLVGYGSQGGVPYWVIKNSWGERWGERGYARIRRGRNICGIESWAIRPLL